MPYQVWVRTSGYEWTFTEDPDHGELVDGITVLAGMRIGWAMPGPHWPRQPEPMTGTIEVNVPDFGAYGQVRAAENDFLAIEVKLDAADEVCLAQFYGDITDYKAIPRDGQEGVTLSLVAVDYTVRLRDELRPQFILADDGNLYPDQDIIGFMWDRGDETGLGDALSSTPWPVAIPPRATDHSYLNLDGPIPTTVPDMIETILDAAVFDSGIPGDLGRAVLQPLVVPETDPTHHGERIGGPVVSITGAYYVLDVVFADPDLLPVMWEIGADIVYLDDIEWSNVKGRTLGNVTTTGVGGDSLARTDSPVAGATSLTSSNVPVILQNTIDAQGVSDWYAARAGFEPWQIDRLVIPVTRVLADGGDLTPPAAGLRLFPDVTAVETDAERRGWAYSTGLRIVGVDDTVTPDGLGAIEGIIVGVECTVDPIEGLTLEVALRRRAIGTEEPIDRVDALLTVPGASVGSALTDFVTRVDLSHITDLDWWAIVEPDGSNIRVYRNDPPDVEVPYDLTRFDQGAQTGELFFTSDLSAVKDNEFKVAAIVGETAYAPTDPFGRNAVWADYDFVTIPSADYAASPSALTLPSDRTGNTPTITRSFTGTAPTMTADGLHFPSGHDGNYKAVGVPFRSVWTMGVRARQSATVTSVQAMMSYSPNSTSAAGYEQLVARASGSNNFALVNTTDGNLLVPTLTQTGLMNSWRRWTGTHDGTTSRTVRCNGANKATDSTVANRPVSPGDTVYFGQRQSDITSPWFGDLDYAYLRNGVLSDAWLTAEALSWESPASFYTIT